MANSNNRRLSKRKKATIEREANYIANNKFKMKLVNPITENQAKLVDFYEQGKNVFAIGSAGTGKTYLTTSLALKDVLKNDKYDKVIFIRSAVQSRDQGFMPGTLKEKMAYFEGPYIDIVNDLFEDSTAYNTLKTRGQIQFMSSSFLRGLTFDHSIIIVDECQSMSYHEMATIMQRVGQNTKIIFCGDTKQNDLIKSKYDVSGLPEFLRVCSKMQSTAIVKFTVDDVVRSGIVKEFILAEEELAA